MEHLIADLSCATCPGASRTRQWGAGREAMKVVVHSNKNGSPCKNIYPGCGSFSRDAKSMCLKKKKKKQFWGGPNHFKIHEEPLLFPFLIYTLPTSLPTVPKPFTHPAPLQLASFIASHGAVCSGKWQEKLIRCWGQNLWSYLTLAHGAESASFSCSRTRDINWPSPGSKDFKRGLGLPLLSRGARKEKVGHDFFESCFSTSENVCRLVDQQHNFIIRYS